MKPWLAQHWMQLVVAAVSATIGVLVHLGKISPNEAVAVGSICAAVGLHLPAITYGGPAQ